MTSSDSPRTFPLTTVERRFWMLHQLNPRAPIANIGRVVELHGELFADDLARAFLRVADNPLLRLRVREERGEPRGFLGDAPRMTIDVDDASDEEVAAAVTDVVKTPYDLEQGPLLRARLLRRGPEHHVLVLGCHHMILDGWGLSRSLPRAIAKAMRHENMSFGDEAALDDDLWIEARAHRYPDPDRVDIDRDTAWWQERLRDAQALPLPLVNAPPARSTGLAHDVEVALPADLMERAEALGKSVSARAVHVFLAAYVTELARACRTRDLLLGTTAAARPGPLGDVDNHEMGCFVRTKALRAVIDEDAPFTEVIKACQRAVRESLEHPNFDAEELSSISAPPIGALFNYIPFSAFEGSFDGVDVNAGRIIAGGTAFPISLTVDAFSDARPGGRGARIVLEVDADLFDEDFAARFVDRVKAVLDDALRRPTTPISRLRRLGPRDVAAIAKNAATDVERRPVLGGNVVPLIERDLREGTAPALVFAKNPRDSSADVAISRAELLRRVRAVARSARGVDGGFVGVCCDDPVNAVAAIFGVLFAGKAYVPIDVAAPAVRRQAIVEQAKLGVVLDDAAVAEAIAAAASDEEEAVVVDAGNAAYVIFTSGSTGTPKGVVVSHNALVSQLQARVGLGFTRPERSALLAPFFFDGSVETLFWSFTHGAPGGATMFVLGDGDRRDPVAARQLLARRRITYTSAVPALWSAMLDAASASDEPLDALAFTIVGGEKLTRPLIAKHHALTQAWLVNEYGPTESTVFSTAWTAPASSSEADAPVPIGRSAPHVTCAVVDDNLEPVPVLEPGELVVAGPGLADGYLNAPAQTAAAFVVGVDGRRLYKTGDIVRLWPDGNLEWLARKDEQVKLRGVRVEPGEVEAALLRCGAAEAAVIVDGQHLLAFVSPSTLREAALLEALQPLLPEAMIPARITVMDALPKTANDKINKRALPKVVVDDVVTLPATPLETTIAAIWSEVLGVSPISVTRSFFAYGGHSLKAALVVRKLGDALQQPVPISKLMVARTVRELARQLTPTTTTTAPAKDSLLLPLTPQKSTPTKVIFLPGIGGHVFTFAGIADRLRNAAAGMRAFGSEPGEEPLATVEDLAKKNLDELDRLGVKDDVVFAGYSFGGLVAYEMALQRAAVGRAPRHVVIFDTMAPGYPKKLPPWTRAMLHAETLARADWQGRLSYLRDRVDSVREKFNLRFARADAFKDAFALDDAELAALDPTARAQLEKLAGISTLAHYRYWPRASIAVPLTLFAAEVDFDWAATRMDDPLKGWRAWTTGALRRVSLKGDHLRLFVDENLAAAAAVLDDVAG